MKFFKILIIAAFFAFLIACTQTKKDAANTTAETKQAPVSQPEATPATTDGLARARQIYSETCIKCHKEDGKGGVRQIEDVKIKAPDFTSERMKNDRDEEWIEVIKHGAKEDGMPAFEGRLKDEEIKDLVKFIRREFQEK